MSAPVDRRQGWGWPVRRWWVVSGLLALGCSGLLERAVEVSTGGSMDIAPNGDVTMTLPDGTKVVTEQGAPVPEGFPLPPPYEGAAPQALVTATTPTGETYWVVTYEMGAPRAQISATYDAWLAANATDATHDQQATAGVVSETFEGRVGEGGVVVTLTEAYGANSVSAIWSPHGLRHVKR